MKDLKNIIFTGGGSGGHVVPAITLIKELKRRDDINIYYLGGKSSVERKLVSQLNVSYFPVSTGKLRRYISVSNFLDFFKFIFGVVECLLFLIRFKKSQTLIFSTGGYVSLPLVVAGGILGFEIYLHEQTSRVGLANKIASYFAAKIFISFESSEEFFPKDKVIYSGYPLQKHCFTRPDENFSFKGNILNNVQKPILLITGGGNGSKLLNDFFKRQVSEIKDDFFIIHQVGEKFIDEFKSIQNDTYYPVSFIENLIEVMKHSDLIISRAGAGTVMELIALRKRSVYVPLKIAQKNEQLHNAQEAQQKVGSLIISEDDLDEIDILHLWGKIHDGYIFPEYELKNGTFKILQELEI